MRTGVSEWVHGDAKYDAGDIVLTNPVKYRLVAMEVYENILFGIANIQNPDDAVAFATKFGLLWSGPDADEYREDYELWSQEAVLLLSTLQMYAWLQDAIDGNEKALALLWKYGPLAYAPLFEIDIPDDNDDLLLERVSVSIAWIVSRGLAGVEEGLVATVEYEKDTPGKFVLSSRPQSLVGAAYHGLALTIANRVSLKACDQCGKLFPVTHGARLYCSETCSYRSRHKRWKEKKEASSVSI